MKVKIEKRENDRRRKRGFAESEESVMTKNKQESAEKLKNGLHIKRLWNPTACDFSGIFPPPW